MKHIFTLGIKENMDERIKVKVMLSNQLTFFLSFIVIIYGIIYYLHAPQLLIFIYLSAFVVALTFFLNYLGLIIFSRILSSVLPTLVGGALYQGLSQGAEDIILGNFVVIFSFILIPFILFDFHEKLPLAFSYLICIVLLLSHRVTNEWIDIKVDNSFFKSPVLDIFSLFVATFTVGLCMYILLKSNEKTEQRNITLLEESKIKSEELEESRKVMEETLAQVEKARKEDENRAWAANGVAELSVIMRKEEDPEKLYPKIISFIVKYIEANQGGLYLVEGETEESKYIQLASLYAYDKRKFVEQKIEIGQGLLGQCYLEKEKIILTQIPENYVHITSGLGEATPHFIAIIPLKADDIVEGMLEIAAFEKLADYKIDFLERIAENMAATIRTQKLNFQTRLLLEEQKQQTEEMRAQEEEMRQNMEELQATQEEMYRKEQEYIDIIEDLKAQLGQI
jgi:hypothetical protein